MAYEEDVKNLVLRLHEVGAVKFGKFIMKTGIETPVYFDLRVMVSYPDIMQKVSNQIFTLINKSEIKYDQICGVPYTALPISTLVSTKANKPMLMRRKEAKSYGTKKRIEGHYKAGDNCIIIEDVITSGSSVAETIEDLQHDNLRVSDAFVVLDRQQGGKNNLEELGVKVHVIATLTGVIKILLDANLITQDQFKDVEEYLKKPKIDINGVAKNEEEIKENRLNMGFKKRAEKSKSKNALTSRILNLMEEKQSMVCLAADVSSSEELLKLARETGPYICILKTHFDAVSDFTSQTKKDLVELGKKFNFLIMEDRKFGDIGNTVSLQYSQIYPWADLVTVHSLPGEGVLSGLKSTLEKGYERGGFLVAELSCEGTLINKEYTEKTIKMGQEHSDFVVGFVCQSPHLVQEPYFLQLTPGVKLAKGGDNLGQTYNTPEHAVLDRGADIAVVGRGIIQSSDPGKEAKIFKDRLWAAYQQRINP